MEYRYTDPKMKQMHEDISYNDRMIEYKKRCNYIKNNIYTCSFISVGGFIFMLFFEILSSWDPDKSGIGILAMLIYSVPCIVLDVLIIKKLHPKYFLLVVAVSIFTAIIKFNLIPVIIGAMNLTFYYITRSMDEVKELEGYPHFLPVKVRNKNN